MLARCVLTLSYNGNVKLSAQVACVVAVCSVLRVKDGVHVNLHVIHVLCPWRRAWHYVLCVSEGCRFVALCFMC
jgi:hypothetical protein